MSYADHCDTHIRRVPLCPHCAQERAPDVCVQTPAEQPADVTTLRLNVQSRTIDLLLRRQVGFARRITWLEEHLQDAFDKQRELQIESRSDYVALSGLVCDLEAENASLRRRVTALEHRCNGKQAAHNALVEQVEELAAVVRYLAEKERSGL